MHIDNGIGIETKILKKASLLCNKVQNTANSEKMANNLAKDNKKDTQEIYKTISGSKIDAILDVNNAAKKGIESRQAGTSGDGVEMDSTVTQPPTQDNQQGRAASLGYGIRNQNDESGNTNGIRSNGFNGKPRGRHETEAIVANQTKVVTIADDNDADEVHPRVVQNRRTKSFWKEITDDENLPSGWFIHIHKKGVRGKGSSKTGQHSYYTYYFTKRGKRLRSKPEVERFLSILENVNGDEEVARKRFNMKVPPTRDHGVDIRSPMKRDLLKMRSSTGSSKNFTNTSCSNSIAKKKKNIKEDSDLGARHPSNCDEIGQDTNNGLNCFGDSSANSNTESINSSHHRRRDAHLSFNPFSTGVIEILDDSDSDVPIDEGKGLDFRKAESKSLETPVAPIVKKVRNQIHTPV